MSRPKNWRSIVAEAGREARLADPRSLFALLETENGHDDIEFGYGVTRDAKGTLTTKPKWKGFPAQARAAAHQLKLTETRYQGFTGQSPLKGGRYSPEFLEYFSSGGEGYPGYAPIGADNDPSNRNKNHLPNLSAIYHDMTTDRQTGQPVAMEAHRPRRERPINPSATVEDYYARARMREDEISELRETVGPVDAERAAANYQRAAKSAWERGMEVAEPVVSFLGETAGDALDAMETASGQVRGVLAGRPGEEVSVEELTGLEPEPIDPEEYVQALSYGPLGVVMQYPNRTVNLATELAADPLNVGLGAIGLAAKGISKGKKAVTAGKEAEEAAVARTTADVDIPKTPPVTGTPKMDQLLREVQTAIKGARSTKEDISVEAQQLLASGKVSLKTIAAGKIGQGGAPEAQAVASLRQSVADELDTLMRQKDVLAPANAEKLLGRLRVNAMLTRQARSLVEIPAGQSVQALRFGQGPAVKTVEDLFELLPEGTPIEQVVDTYRIMKTTREKADYLGRLGRAGKITKGVAMQVMLNGLISGVATPVWNTVAMGGLTTAKVFERWRMSKFADSNVVPGEAGVLARGLFTAYWRALFGERQVRARLRENFGRLGSLSKGVSQGDLDRMKVLEKAVDDSSLSDAERFVHAKELRGLEARVGPGGGGKFDIRRTISKETFNATGLWGGAIDAVGHAINLPTYVVGATDSIVRFAVETANADVLAYRMAYQNVWSGVRKGERLSQKQINADIKARRQQLAEHPETNTVLVEGRLMPINDAARDVGALTAMMAPLTGSAKAFDNITKNSLIARTFLTFFRVMALTAREGLVRIPVFNRLVPSVRQAINQGGEAAARVKAQVQTGWAMAGLTMGLHQAGVVTGGGPVDKEARKDWMAAGNQPYSLQFEVDGQRVHLPYNRAAPIGNVMGFMADMAYRLERLGDIDERFVEGQEGDLALEIASAMTAASTSLVINEMTSGEFRNFFAAMADAETAPARLRTLLASKGAMFMPNSAFARKFNEVLNGERKATDGLMEKVSTMIPSLSEGMPGYHSRWGEVGEVPNEGAWETAGAIAGVQVRAFDANDPRHLLIQHMDLGRVTFSAPSRIVDGVRLSTAAYEELKELFGKGIYNSRTGAFIGLEAPYTSTKAPGGDRTTLTSLLWGTIFDAKGEMRPSWTRGTPGPKGGKDFMVDSVVSRLKTAAKQELLRRHPDLQLEGFDLKEFRLTGPVDPEVLERDVNRAKAHVTNQTGGRRPRVSLPDVTIGR